MAKQKSRFPSYGLVRGPSHAQGGVAGVVAGKQPVELEGGEWVVPKEVVPDYLPQLVQMTNEGRAMQGMDNGNSAMDALIASASMQTGVVSPKSPHYQEGGRMNEVPYQSRFEEPIDESVPLTPYEKAVWDIVYGGIGKSFEEMTPAEREGLGAKYRKEWIKHSIQGWPLYDAPADSIFKEGGTRYKDFEEWWNSPEPWGAESHKFRATKGIDYQQGGQVLPRQQQEVRRPEVYGPPAPPELDLRGPTLRDAEFLRQYIPDTSAQDTSGAALDSMLMKLMMRDVNESINPLTGDTINWDAIKQFLKGRMDKSRGDTTKVKVPYSPHRKVSRQGGPVTYQEGGMVGGTPLMQDVSQDRRIKPLQPDKYIIKQDVPGGTSQREMEVPKLSSAYLQALGTETPLSRRQKSFFNSPEKPSEQYMNSFSGLNGRVLLQRLINESS